MPLRMMGTCYWTQLLDLVASAGVKTIHGRTDECLWTDDGIDFLQNQSWLVSLGWVAKHWIGNILPYWRLSRAVQRALRREGPSPTMTFGDWLVSQQISPSEICIAQLIRRLSWMLSCTYSQVCVCSFGRRSPLRRNEPMRRRHWRSQSMIDPSVLRLCRSGACLPCGRSSTVHREPALLWRARPMASATKARNIAGLSIGGGAAAEADHWDPHPVQCSDRKGELRARTTGHRWRTVRSRGTPRLTPAVWLLVCGLTIVASRYQIVGRCLRLKLWQCTSWCVGSRLRRM